MVRTSASEDHPGKQELRVASHDEGRSWYFMDGWLMVELPHDLVQQVEIVGGTERNLLGRILFDPTRLP